MVIDFQQRKSCNYSAMQMNHIQKVAVSTHLTRNEVATGTAFRLKYVTLQFFVGASCFRLIGVEKKRDRSERSSNICGDVI